MSSREGTSPQLFLKWNRWGRRLVEILSWAIAAQDPWICGNKQWLNRVADWRTGNVRTLIGHNWVNQCSTDFRTTSRDKSLQNSPMHRNNTRTKGRAWTVRIKRMSMHLMLAAPSQVKWKVCILRCKRRQRSVIKIILKCKEWIRQESYRTRPSRKYKRIVFRISYTN